MAALAEPIFHISEVGWARLKAQVKQAFANKKTALPCQSTYTPAVSLVCFLYKSNTGDMIFQVLF